MNKVQDIRLEERFASPLHRRRDVRFATRGRKEEGDGWGGRLESEKIIRWEDEKEEGAR